MLPMTEPGLTPTTPLEPSPVGPTDPLLNTSALDSLVAILPESFSEADLTAFATDLAGSLTFADGSVSVALTAPGDPITESFDIAAELDELADALTGITATLGLEEGVATLTGTDAASEPLTGMLDLGNLTDAVIIPFLSDVEGELTIDGGVIDIELGEITGSLSVLDGELDIDLSTPFGDIDEAIPFEEGTEFSVPFGDGDATFDLFEGIVTLTSDDPAAEPVELNFSDIPLTIAVDDGLATVEVDGLGGIGDPFDVEQLLGELLTPVIAELEGEFTLTDGVLEGTLAVAEDDTPDGPVDPTPTPDPMEPEEDGFSISVDLGALLEDASDFLTSLTGSLTFTEGTATSTLMGGGSDFSGETDLTEFVDEIGAIAEVLDVFGLLEADEPMTEEPVAEEPMEEPEEPMAEEPEEPVVEEPVVEEPVVEEPVVEEPVMEEPVAEEPMEEPEEPMAEEPEEPVVEEPMVEEPVMEEPVAEEPAMEEPTMEEDPMVEEPTSEEPVIDISPIVIDVPAVVI